MEFFRLHSLLTVGDAIRKGDIDPTAIGTEAESVVAPITGLVTASGKDFEGEDLDQDGLDWDYFKKSGWFNYEHHAGIENIIGYPDRSKDVERCMDEDGNEATRVHGFLLLGTERGRKVHEVAKALCKAGDGRQIGFSVEGQVLERDHKNPKMVRKARVRNVAITAHPVRDTARFELVKSLDGLADVQAELAAAGISSAGYQYKTAMDGSTLAALLPEDLEGGKPAPVAKPAQKLTFQILCDRIAKAFPLLAEADVQKAAIKLVEAAKKIKGKGA